MIEISKVVERDRKADHLKEAMLHIRQKYT